MGLPTECDVLVIGAGPAGSTTARYAAETGIDVVLIDKRKELGLPVQCAEHIPLQVIHFFDSKKEIIAQKINYMRTVMPNGDTILTESKGFIIHRDLFDKYLGDKARNTDARIFTETEALTVYRSKVKIRQAHYEQTITPRVIVDASGPNSVIGKALGIRNTSYIFANQFLMPLKEERDFTEVYFRKYIPGGYGWVFPKVNVCNVGVGVNPVLGVTPRVALKEFIKELVARSIITDCKLKTFAGMIPTGGLLSLHFENVLLVGDAGGQCHPITGAGVPFALLCGQMAGKYVAEAIQENDLKMLMEYEEDCIDAFGGSLMHAFKKRKIFESYWQNIRQDLNELVKKTWVVFEEYHSD
ncbi:MAG: geranylgeranyl reductase family protein [Promethearchaeota archaeon]